MSASTNLIAFIWDLHNKSEMSKIETTAKIGYILGKKPDLKTD